MATKLESQPFASPRAATSYAAASHSKEALREAHAVRQLSSMTCDELDEQGERLMKASRSIAAVHDDINITDRLIGGIESFWTAVANKFRFDNTKDNRRAHARHEDKLEAQLANDDNMHAIAEHDASQEARRAELRRMSERTAQSKFGVKEVDDYFEETDKDLDELSDVLAEIKRDSLRMRAGIARDNAVLDHLEPEAARLEERVRKSNTRIDRIIK